MRLKRLFRAYAFSLPGPLLLALFFALLLAPGAGRAALSAGGAKSGGKDEVQELPLAPAGGKSYRDIVEPVEPDAPEPQAPTPRAVKSHAPGAPEDKSRGADPKKREDGGESAGKEENGKADALPPPASPVPPLSEDAHRDLERRGIVRVEIKPARPRIVAAPFSGVLAEVAVRDGEAVEEGRLLAVFDTRALEREREDVRLAMNTAVERVQASAEAPDRLRESAREELARAADKLREAEERLASARQSSPFKGLVTEVFARAGQHLKRGEAILELAEEGDMEIVCTVPSAWISSLQPGRLIWVYVEEIGRSFEAGFTRFGGKVDSATRRIKAYAKFRQTPPGLLPGMGGRADFFPKTSR